jgi:hypothetical protein
VCVCVCVCVCVYVYIYMRNIHIHTHKHTHTLVTDIRRSLVRANGEALLKNLAIDLKADEAGLEGGKKFSKVLYSVFFIVNLLGR